MTDSRKPSAATAPPDVDDADENDPLFDLPNFVPVPVRDRSDGWTAARQVAFVEALSQSGCVTEAARAVGMSVRTAYRLRQHVGAMTFRMAWDAAIDFAIKRLADVALSRAINGVARPVFHKGEQVGERRYFDERLTQFLLRTRDPVRYGRWIDKHDFQQPPDGDAIILSTLSLRLARGDAPAPRIPGEDDDEEDWHADMS
jgi:hypothetical protein